MGRNNGKKFLLFFRNSVGQFLYCMGLIFGFQALFGRVNILAGIAVIVAIMSFPVTEMAVQRRVAVLGLIILFPAAGAVGQLALISPLAAFPIDFLLILVIMLWMGEPAEVKPHICFVLCFIFCESNPVPAVEFPLRFLGLLSGGTIAAIMTAFAWGRKGFGKDGRNIREQIAVCAVNRSLNLRMALGISLAILAASLLKLDKPLWVSVVVMSLTQIKLDDTVKRIIHRSLGTVAGIGFFYIVFCLLLPPKYAIVVIIFLGFLGGMTQEYKYKQMINAVSALNASLVILGAGAAIWNRVLCLLGGICIVLLMFVSDKIIRQIVHICRNKEKKDTLNFNDTMVRYTQ